MTLWIAATIALSALPAGSDAGPPVAGTPRADAGPPPLADAGTPAPPAEIREVIHAHHQQMVDHCYEPQLAQTPEAKAKVSVHFTIDANGRVSNAVVTDDPLHDLETCMLGEIRSWVFPAQGSLTDVTYPFLVAKMDAQTIVGDPKTVVVGSLSKDMIAAVIRSHQGEIKHCYEIELQEHPDLQGKISVAFVISGDGNIAEARVSDATLDSQPLQSCMVEKIRSWRFPKPAGGGQVFVTYPWVFKTSK